eukprot:10895267-Lingulodinium_polyedra.AAC.1
MPASAATTYTTALTSTSRASVWGPGWILIALEPRWLISGGPRCPTTAAAASSVTALLAGRCCGPLPFQQKA